MLKTTLQLKHINLKHLLNSNLNNNISLKYSCLCGHVFQNGGPRWRENVRIHSTQSDQHRQKVVIETSTPIIEKLNFEKVLPIDKDDKKFELWERIDPYFKLARWDKPIGVYLLFWPCAWSIALGAAAAGAPAAAAAGTGALFLAGAGLMRGAGCTLNDMWDRDIDRQVERTRDRPLASGAVSMRQAAGFLVLQLSASALILAQLNCYSVMLGASSLLLVAAYPLAKRFTNYPQLFLGGTFNWGALLGYSAITGGLEPPALLLYAGAVAWTVVYDTIYAHQDKRDDARAGVRSTALTFGARTAPALFAALAASAGCLGAALHAAGLGAAAAAPLAAYVASVARQIYTVDLDNPQDCADKFKSNSYVGLIVLLAILGGGYDTYAHNRQRQIDSNTVYDKHQSCLTTLLN